MDVLSERDLLQDIKLSMLEELLVLGLSLDGSWKITRFNTSPLVSFDRVAMNIILTVNPQMSPGNVAWGNGRFQHLDSSYYSKLQNMTIPTAVYGERTAHLTHSLIRPSELRRRFCSSLDARSHDSCHSHLRNPLRPRIPTSQALLAGDTRIRGSHRTLGTDH